MSKDKGQTYEETNKKNVSYPETEIVRLIEEALSKRIVEPDDDILSSLFDEEGNLKISEEKVAELMKILERGKEADLDFGL